MSDTMIHDPRKVRPNAIPGVLKCLVIDLRLTISFAGSVEISLKVIREAKDIWKRTNSLNDVARHLSLKSQEGGCDFIVSAHTPDPHLLAIKKGLISSNLDFCWIGDFQPINEMFARDPKLNTANVPGLNGAERQFTSAFANLFSDPKVNEFVGGVPVNQIGTSVGHAYQSIFLSGFSNFTIGLPEAQQDLENAARKNEQRDYEYCSISPDERGVALLGVYMPQARTGYIHSPFEFDDPLKIENIDQEKMYDFLRAHAQLLGGIIIR